MMPAKLPMFPTKKETCCQHTNLNEIASLHGKHGVCTGRGHTLSFTAGNWSAR